jgi:hypothetical protein
MSIDDDNNIDDEHIPESIPDEEVVDTGLLDLGDAEFQDEETKRLNAKFSEMFDQLQNNQSITAKGLTASLKFIEELKASLARTNKQIQQRADTIDKNAESLSSQVKKQPSKPSSNDAPTSVSAEFTDVDFNELVDRIKSKIDIPELEISKLKKEIKKQTKSSATKNKIMYFLVFIIFIMLFVDVKSLAKKTKEQVVNKKISVSIPKDTPYMCEDVEGELLIPDDRNIDGVYQESLFLFDVNSGGKIYKCYTYKKFLKGN